MKVSLYLDQRKLLKDGKYAVKVQVSAKDKTRWRQVYFSTGVSLHPYEWEKVKTGAVRGPLRAKRETILKKESRALDILKDSPFISIDTFRTLFTGTNPGRKLNVQDMYAQQMARLVERGQYGTSTIYKAAAKMLLNKFGPELTLNAVDKDLLVTLESELTVSPSTIGIYLRTLRTIFNIALDRKLIGHDYYPFGRKQYRIPSGGSFKRALTEKEKNTLLAYRPRSVAERSALDVWRFSYYCNGMNCADMALLTTDCIKGDVLTYVRKKTARTERNASIQVAIIRKEIKHVITRGTSKFVFGVLDGSETPEWQRKKITQWNKTVNKYLKRVGRRLKLPLVLTTYTARHTAATMLLQKGANLLYIKDRLGHSSISTTENYLKSLDLKGQRMWTGKL